MKRLCIFLSVLEVLCSFTAPDYGRLDQAHHPRLFMDDTAFEGMKSQVLSGRKRHLSLIHDSVMAVADSVASRDDSLVFQLDDAGRRILQVSQNALLRIFSCAYAWRFSGQEQYLSRARRDLLSVCAFPGWNARRHFLDTGEMAAAVGIGYDWLYGALSAAERAAAEKALEHFAFDPALAGVWNLNFYQSRGNWNQVCNGGLVTGALAVYECCPGKARDIIGKAVEANPLAMTLYAPDGNYPEGVNYWSYGTRYEMMMLCALESCLGTDFGLSRSPGFDKTGEYCLFTYGPSGMVFNYSDNRQEPYPLQALWYLAFQQDRPDLLWRELRFIEAGRYGKDGSEDRFLPLIPYFASMVEPDTGAVPERKMFLGEGPVPVMMIHSEMGNPSRDHFVGFKGGCPRESHSHMDNGSFVYDSQGVRWAFDMPRPEYAEMEVPIKRAGGSLWDMRQGSLRWQQRAYNNQHHNTLTINGALHRVGGRARFTEKMDLDSLQGAVLDMSESFEGQAARVIRTVTLDASGIMRVKDEVRACDTLDAHVRWTLITDAWSVPGEDGFVLEKDNRRLSLRFSSPAETRLVRQADGAFWNIGFEALVPAGGEVPFVAAFEDLPFTTRQDSH